MDEFPSLEIALGLGLLVLVVRTVVLLRSAGAVALEHDALIKELGHSDRSRALRLAEGFESAAYSEVALAVLTRAGELVGASRDEARAELERALSEAEAAQTRRVGIARGRDLVILALLVGVVAFVMRAGWHASHAFYALAGGCAAVVVAGLFMRGAMSSRLAERRASLLDAAVEHALARIPTAPTGPCPMCDATECVTVVHPERVKSDGAALPLGLAELYICRACGWVRGKVVDPDAIAVGEQTDTQLSASPYEETSVSGFEGEEHEG